MKNIGSALYIVFPHYETIHEEEKKARESTIMPHKEEKIETHLMRMCEQETNLKIRKREERMCLQKNQTFSSELEERKEKEVIFPHKENKKMKRKAEKNNAYKKDTPHP